MSDENHVPKQVMINRVTLKGYVIIETVDNVERLYYSKLYDEGGSYVSDNEYLTTLFSIYGKL